VSGPFERFVRVEEEVEVGLGGVFFDGFFDEGESAGFGRGVGVLRTIEERKSSMERRNDGGKRRTRSPISRTRAWVKTLPLISRWS
jgi:hypothetical protein